jgi:hypothetical protein
MQRNDDYNMGRRSSLYLERYGAAPPPSGDLNLYLRGPCADRHTMAAVAMMLLWMALNGHLVRRLEVAFDTYSDWVFGLHELATLAVIFSFIFLVSFFVI